MKSTVIITGANAGIGLATATFLAGHADWHVILACRDPMKANTALKGIRQTHPKGSVECMPLDLFSLHSVRCFAATLASQDVPPLLGLILNAGGINMKAKAPKFTEDGFERIFQLNFLGHFLL